MSYKLYKTEGIVIKSQNTGESDKILSVFTKDFGRIELFAKGARKINSKLNQHLNLFDYSRLVFVVGKEFLRITDAEKISSWDMISASFAKLESGARITRFLDRMLKGQEKNAAMWNFIIEALSCLNSDVSSNKDIVFLEKIIFLKILFFLGYVDLDKIPKNFMTDDLKKNILSECSSFSNDITKAIKKGVEASQM